MRTTTDRVFPVCCLACGAVRTVRKTTAALLDSPACGNCGYVGWREAAAGERERREASYRGRARLVLVG